MESWAFRKVELWVVALLALVGVIGAAAYGALVLYVANGGQKAGLIGTIAYQVAALPIEARAVVAGEAQPPDYVAESKARADRAANYGQLPLPDGIEGTNPLILTAQAPHQPISVMLRLNESGDEHLYILDEERSVVSTYPVNATSRSGKFDALIGTAEPYMFDDGSLLMFPAGADGLYRQGLCGEVKWSQDGLYHHHFSVVDGKIYLLGLPTSDVDEADIVSWNNSDIINVIDSETGAIERSVTIGEIAEANAGELDPLLWERWRDTVNDKGVLTTDFVHLNKIEVLSADMASSYPGLPPGAWMLSSRHLNLIFIVDPQTLKIVWHSQGYTQVQHDPKFVGDNRIWVFNNSFHGNHPDTTAPQNYSSIMQHDFSNGEWTEVFNAAPYDGYTFHSGNFDIGDRGELMMSLTLQGRILEVDASGHLLTDIVNLRDDSTVYWVKHAQYLSQAQLQIVRNTTCAP